MIRIFWYKDPRLQERECRKALRRQVAEKLLRNLLGISDETPLAIDRKERGKPYLPDYPGFHFNQSDSGEWMVIGVAGSEIGIDIERIRLRPYQELLNRWFLPEERWSVEEVQKTQPGKSLVEFIRLWTCKESILKYIGCGLGAEFQSHPVLSEKRDGSGPGHPYGIYQDRKLAFYSRILPQDKEGTSMDYAPAHAGTGDYILSLCYEAGNPLQEIREEFLPKDFHAH